jgi:DNA-binding GntR family transcriptional regulator
MPQRKSLPTALGKQDESLSDLVYRHLRDQILWGTLPPGSRLSLRGLAEHLGVSPMPVRDALRRLATEELVEVAPRSSTRVAQISLDTIREMLEVRTYLEPLSGRLAVTHFTAAHLDRLQRYQENPEKATSQHHPEEWHRWHQESHLLIFRKCGNQLVRRMTESLWNRNLRHLTGRVVTQADFRERRAKEHHQIIRAFRRRDADAVEAAYRHHMVEAGIATMQFLRTLVPKGTPLRSRKPPEDSLSIS